MEYGCSQCDILKISDNEIRFLSGKEDYDEGFKDGYEKGARDAFRAMFKLGFIPRMRISRNRR